MNRCLPIFFISFTVVGIHASDRVPNGSGQIPDITSGTEKAQFLSPTNWYVGDHNRIWMTKDAGASWLSIFSIRKVIGHETRDYSFTVVSADKMIVCTGKGIFMIDENNTSLVGQAPTGFVVRKCLFQSEQAGWLVGHRLRKDFGSKPDVPAYEGALAKTKDGGRTWTIVTLPAPVKKGEKWDLRDIVFFDSSRGMIAADGGLFVTNDGGLTWRVASVPYDTYESVRWSSSGLIWVTESQSDHIVTSQDSGATWSLLDVPLPAGAWPMSVMFLNNNRGLLANGGFLYRSSNGGKTWQRTKVDGLFFYSLYEIGGTQVAFADWNGKKTAATSDDGMTWHDPSSNQVLREAKGEANERENCLGCLSTTELEKCAKHKEWPSYPAMAQPARVEGTVSIEVEINPQGEIASAKILSGHPLLARSALEAAKHWTFDLDKCGARRQPTGLLIFTFHYH